MPELPEVQTVVSQLAAKTVGLGVVGFRSEWAKAVRPSVQVFRERIIGAKIEGVRRFGKHIVIDLGKYSIVIHLKMTGHLLVRTPANEHDEHFHNDPYNGYIRHVIELSEGARIEFSDLRKFGWLEVVPTIEVEHLKSIQALGVDALSEKFTLRYFQAVLAKKPRGIIGALLLEQQLIAGIGNIYRNEALFRAGVLPMRAAGTLTRSETKKLHRSIIEVLREAVILRGMSDGDFRDTDGRMGAFEENAFVYGREGLPCKKCGTMVIRAKLGQRSVFYCPHCQQ